MPSQQHFSDLHYEQVICSLMSNNFQIYHGENTVHLMI
jgi:hypothetical protein